ncbi:MAG TPA: hypothetical protein VF463_15355 [Sphingobium sp.]
MLGEEGATIHVTGRTVESGAAPLPGTISETVAEVDRRGVRALPIRSGRRKISAPHRTAPHRTAPHRTAPHRTAPHLTSPHLTSPYRTGHRGTA